MGSKDKFRLNVDELNKFLNHIQNENNTDIIFSAPFGTGKTWFLKEEFSKDEGVKSSFNVIHLFPVNYSIASNDDIFNLIKYDILFELKKSIDPSINLDHSKFSKLLTLQSYLNHEFKPISFVKDLLLKSGLVNKAPFEIYELFKKEYESCNSYHKTVNKGEDQLILDSIKELSSTSLLKEMDPISVLISDLTDKIRGDKKNILIIDDLDRIDPEHIFRIINVFSAHRDYETKEHKYGFDKVILVCDIENIRRIYQHKYGIDVDFNGYISKFSSIEIFHYNVRNYLSQALDNFFSNADYFSIEDVLLQSESPYCSYNFANKRLLDYNKEYQLFKFFVNFLIDIGKINIRDLTKPYRFEVRNKVLKTRKRENFRTVNFPILIIIDYLDTVLGGKKAFFNILRECNKNGDDLSFLYSPSLFEDPQKILIHLLEEIVGLSVMPNKLIENTYRILPKEELRQLQGISKNDPIEINYISEFDHKTNSFKINVQSKELKWERLTFYNFNQFLLEKLEDFYRKYPHY